MMLDELMEMDEAKQSELNGLIKNLWNGIKNVFSYCSLNFELCEETIESATIQPTNLPSELFII